MEMERLKGLTAKIETVYKTDAAPTPATDGIQLEENIWSAIEWGYLEENLRDNVAQQGFGRAGGARPSGRFAHITVVVAGKGAGVAYAAGVVPELDVLLRISGHRATLASGAWTYAPRSSGFESATVYAYGGGLLWKLVGTRGILSEVSIIANQISRFTFDLWGVLAEAPVEAALPAITYPRRTVIPPRVAGAALDLNGWGAEYRSFTFRQGLELTDRPRGGDPHGHAGYTPVDWNPEFTAVVDRPALAAFDPFGLRDSGTLFPWSIQVGDTQYNRFTLSGPAARLLEGPPSADRGFAMMDLRCRAQNTDAPDTAYTLVFD